MHLYKVKELQGLKLGKGKILVEFVKKPQGKIILTDEASSSADNVLRMEVVASAHEDIPVGAIIVEARFALGMAEGNLKFGDRNFMIAFGHDVALWTEKDNFDEDAKEVIKDSDLIKEVDNSKIIL